MNGIERLLTNPRVTVHRDGAPGTAKAAFLEELIVRREVAISTDATRTAIQTLPGPSAANTTARGRRSAKCSA